MNRGYVYLDNASTRRLLPGALDAMTPYMTDEFSVPSASHDMGRRAKVAIENARVSVASIFNAKPGEIYFTSGAAEANNTCLKGIAAANKTKGMRIFYAATEPLSVLNPLRALEEDGFEIKAVQVDRNGNLDLDDLEKKLDSNPILIAISLAGDEIGTIQPVKEIASMASERGVHVHVDISTGAGFVPIDLTDLNITSASISSHRFGGPKGAGAFYLKEGARMKPLIHGGIQESGLRAGTENVPGIVGMAKALEIRLQNMEEASSKLENYQQSLKSELSKSLEDLIFTGHETSRLPGHLSFCIPGMDGEALVMELSSRGVYASSGSACRAGADKISHVLKAIGLSDEAALGSIVMAADIDNELEEIPRVVEALKESIKELGAI